MFQNTRFTTTFTTTESCVVLREDLSQWPHQKVSEAYINIEERIPRSMVITHAERAPRHNDMYDLIIRCSSLGKLLRITALCRRYLQLRQQSTSIRPQGFITVQELNWSLEFWIKLVQAAHFADDISRSQSGDHLLNKSPLKSLNPFISHDGLLRVGGRLHKSNLPYTKKHPIILPKINHLTHLLISQAHRTTLHGGPLLMLAHLLKRYWILSSKTLLRTYLHKCMVCFRHRATTSQQLMGNLPAPRVTSSRPFQHIWTKAIHLELVSDLTSNAFIASFKRFTARRGRIQSLYSDFATNFVGSNRHLAFLHQESTRTVKPEIAALLAQDGTIWNFIPPASVHFGGLWEAGVKSVKHHLRRIMGETLLTFEELTLLCQIESCLNSRPLCPISNDPDDYSYITPGHFLIVESPITTREPTLLEVKTNYLNRYQQVQKIYNHFWKIWSTEYLSRLQQRPKWLQTNKHLVIGQLELIKEDGMPLSKWLLSRIIDTHPGSDGRVRVVTIKCQNAVYKRPVTKLCLLPIPDNEIHD